MSDKEKNLITISFPGTIVLFIILLILKFTLIPQMGWWWVFSPIWIPFAIMGILLILIIIVLIIKAIADIRY